MAGPPPASGPSPRPAAGTDATAPRGAAPYRDAFLAELKAAKPTFYNLVVAQALSIQADHSGVTFAFQPNQKVPKAQCEDNRGWVQGIVEKLTGAKLPVNVVFTDGSAPAPAAPAAAPPAILGALDPSTGSGQAAGDCPALTRLGWAIHVKLDEWCSLESRLPDLRHLR